jgi:hypothetical protein
LGMFFYCEVLNEFCNNKWNEKNLGYYYQGKSIDYEISESLPLILFRDFKKAVKFINQHGLNGHAIEKVGKRNTFDAIKM